MKLGGFSTSNKVKNHCSRVKPVLLKSFFASDRILKVIIDLPSMINYVQSDHEVKIYNAAGSKPGLSPAQEGHTHPHHFQNHLNRLWNQRWLLYVPRAAFIQKK